MNLFKSMKLVKNISLACAVSALIFSAISPLNVKAEETNDITPGTTAMQKEVHQQYDNLETVKTSTKYLKVENVSKDPKVVKTKITEYTKEDYIKELEKEEKEEAKNKNSVNNLNLNKNILGASVTTPVSQYGWIVLTLEVNKSYRNDGTYDIYGFYEWKKFPFFRGTDFIALGHDSNTVFHPTKSSGLIRYYNSYSKTSTETTFNNYSSGFTYAGGDVGYKFKLNTSNYIIPMGYISVNASRVNTESNLVFKYLHQEISVSISPSLALNGLSIGVNAAAQYDSADIGIAY